MQENLRLIRVFIGSPGGLEDERQAAHAVVKEINQHNSDHWGSLFKLMGWEEAIPGYQRAQDKINEDLDRCDYFIGVMWNKWGSKPSSDPDGYTSGFEEEFYRSSQRIEAGQMKDMAMFFKSIEVPTGMEPGPEIKKVLNFRKKCVEEKKVFFGDFTDIGSFKDAIRAKFMEIGWREYRSFKLSNDNTEQEDQPPTDMQDTEANSSIESDLIEEEAKEFLSCILQRSAAWDATEPREIARFRLISASVSRSGNDDTHLGTHDANLVFKHYRNAALSDQELTALIDCGVNGFDHQNVPLWRWIAKADMEHGEYFRVFTLAVFGSNSEQIGAIRVMQDLNLPFSACDGHFGKAEVLKSWLSNDTDSRVLSDVVAYLGANASESDIPLIEQASTVLKPDKMNLVEGAIVEIISRRSVEEALSKICKQKVSAIGSPLSTKLLATPQSLTTETLTSCLSAKSDSIRVGSARILFERGEINEESAYNLLTDDNTEMRRIAAEVLHSIGKTLGDEVLEKALKSQRSVGLGFFGNTAGEPDTTQLELYRANRLAELDSSQLAEKADDNFLESKCLETLFELHGTKVSSRIRQSLNDNFKAYFNRSTASFRNRHASDDGAISILDEVIPSIRERLRNCAVQALCKLQKSADLTLIRHCLDNYDVQADRRLFHYLARFGDWQDVERILKLGVKATKQRGILATNTISMPGARAAALLSVGKNRIADLLNLELNTGIRTALLKQVPKPTFVSLTDELILRELAHPASECRAIVALRCVQTLSKTRVTELLHNYIENSENRYYNSIHWLDLGASFTSKISKTVAQNELVRR